MKSFSSQQIAESLSVVSTSGVEVFNDNQHVTCIGGARMFFVNSGHPRGRCNRFVVISSLCALNGVAV